MKIYDEIANCCLIDKGSRKNGVPKIIIKEPGLQCTNDTPGRIIGFLNSL